MSEDLGCGQTVFLGGKNSLVFCLKNKVCGVHIIPPGWDLMEIEVAVIALDKKKQNKENGSKIQMAVINGSRSRALCLSVCLPSQRVECPKRWRKFSGKFQVALVVNRLSQT
ncbi:hypothetical protein Dimus_017623 [Dionaea muscipula]